ncbi:hypothetical protein BHE74_00000946 [Ensete ventricosum]|nr:hypothetical protein BHE74_00000946 [Ensete ventricosum]
MHLSQRLEMPSRRFGTQLFKTAKPIPHRRRIQPIAARADQVVLAVANHQGGGRVQAFFAHQMRDQLDFVGARAVQLTAVDHLEVLGEIEMPGDLASEYPRLRRGDVELAALAAQVFQQRHHTLEHVVFIQPGDLEAFAIEIHRLPGLGFIKAVELHERLQQRRADKVFEFGQVRLVDAQFAKGILDRAGDALARVFELHVFRGAVGEKGTFFVSQWANLFNRAAHVQKTALEFLAGRNQATGADDHVVFHHGTVHHDAAHADQDAIAHRAAMQHDFVGDGHVVADQQRKTVRVEGPGVGDVQHAAVLYAGACTDADAVHVAANDRQRPDRAVGADFDIADHHRRNIDKSPGAQGWRVVLIGAKGHDSLSLFC